MGEALDPALSERLLVTRLRQHEIVAAFGLFALRAKSADSVLEQICDLAARGLETRFAKVLEYRPASHDLLLRNGVGWKPGVVGHVVLGADLASPAGFALQTRLPVVSNHLTEESRFRTPAVLVEHGINRAINVIIEGDETVGAPYGVLEADSSDRLSFTSDDVAFLQSLANVLAAAISRDRHLATQQHLLREKDILMQEVHHRIKNNLQLVQTMLQLQARGLADTAERTRLTEAAARIMSIAAVHRRLHAEGVVEQVDLPPHLAGLLDDLGASLGPADETRPITLDVEPMLLPAEHVTPVGLIVVELVTNALKYGAGPTTVRLRKTAAGVDVTVEDCGKGFPPGFKPAASRSLGMRLVGALARGQDAFDIGAHAGGARVSVHVTLADLAPRH